VAGLPQETTGAQRALSLRARCIGAEEPQTRISSNLKFHYVDMISGIPAVGITQNECFLSCDTVVVVVRYVGLVSSSEIKLKHKTKNAHCI
jgi:hypothetical protein